MKIWKILMIGWMGMTVMATAQPIVNGSSTARFFQAVPSNALYHSLGSFYNPAQLTYNHGGEMELFWGGREGENYPGFLSVTSALGRLGMGYQRIELGDSKFSQYRLGTGWGDRTLGLGLGYTWNQGDNDLRNQVVIGLLWRPGSWVSFSSTWERAVSGRKYTLDGGIAIRPLADSRLTLFGHYYYLNEDWVDGSAWSWGGEIRLYPGCRLALSYFRYNDEIHWLAMTPAELPQTGSFHSLHLSLRLDLGSIGFRTAGHYDHHDHYAYQTYGVRLGFPREKLPEFHSNRKIRLMKLDLNHSLDYSHHPWQRDHSILSLQKLIRDLSDRNDIDGLYLKIGGFSAPPSLVYEIRHELEHYRSHHKIIQVYLENPDLMDYYLASAADTIMMDELGMMPTLGLIFSGTYYKGLLDKLGIGVEEWRYFKYKSAFEALSRNDMSEGDREQKQKILDDFYRVIQSALLGSRGFKDSILQVLFDREGLMTADRALELGLIDRVARGDRYLADHPRYQIINTSFYSMIRPVQDRWGEPGKIAVVYALGACDMDSGIQARRLEQIMKSLGRDDAVRAIVLRVDSPGGDPLASDLVAEQVRVIAQTKPVIVSQGWLAASGGYWLSMYASRIVTTPFTLTGSIGVIGGWFYNQGLKEKMGLSTDGVRIGSHAELMQGMALPLIGTLPDRNLNEQEKKKVAEVLMNSYQFFTRKVAQGRKMREEEVRQIAEGRVWTGYSACQIGLADQQGNLMAAVEMAAAEAGIGDLSNVEIVEYHKPGFGLRDLMGIETLETRLENSPQFEYWRIRMKYNGKPLMMVDDYYQMP